MQVKIRNCGAWLLGGAKVRELDLLHDDIPVRVRENFFFNAVPLRDLSVGQSKCRNPRLDRSNFKSAVAFFFREKTRTISDDQPQVARASRVHSREINVVEDSMTCREPDAAGSIERGAYASLRARSTAWRNARPTGSVNYRITNK